MLFKVDHGSPDDAIRHIGDLGNLESVGNGKIKVHVRDKMALLTGKHSVS